MLRAGETLDEERAGRPMAPLTDDLAAWLIHSLDSYLGRILRASGGGEAEPDAERRAGRLALTARERFAGIWRVVAGAWPPERRVEAFRRAHTYAGRPCPASWAPSWRVGRTEAVQDRREPAEAGA